ncbi:hypothetical protein GCM10009864_35500 [Streptomyces lunalinharesii]|uniref:Uncharacterized protein n=1 Tax=Streptomyces lunalinharesii TaxID=333384 RepID=A0ABN3RYR2_9ACTN
MGIQARSITAAYTPEPLDKSARPAPGRCPRQIEVFAQPADPSLRNPFFTFEKICSNFVQFADGAET